MLNRAYIVAGIILLIVVLSIPVMANEPHITHSVDYNLEGKIEFKKQVGFLKEPSIFLQMPQDNSGGEYKQTVFGSGEVTKAFKTLMIKNKIELEDSNQLLTATEPSSELDLITVFDRDRWGDADWAVWIAPDPGEIGIYNIELVSARGQHGAYPLFGDYNNYDPYDIKKDEYAYDNLNDKIIVGPEFVGNYYEIDQYLYLAEGLTKRYITLNMTEEMSVEGMSEIEESLEAQWVPAGKELIADWAIKLNSGFSAFRTIPQKDAYYLKRYADYLLNGNIELEKRIGILQQEVIGDGILAKTITVDRLSNFIEVDDVNYVETALDAEEKLTLVSVIRPSLPPNINVLLDNDDALVHALNMDYGYGFSRRYQDSSWLWWSDWFRDPTNFSGQSNVLSDTMLFGPYQGNHSLHPLLYYLFWLDPDMVESLTEQVWATSITPERGHYGQLNLNFEQSNHWPSSYSYIYDTSGFVNYSQLYKDGRVGPSDGWWIATDYQGLYPVIGDAFIGNYLTLEQYSQLSMGTIIRYIDLSSLWTGAYLHEDATVEGQAEIRDAFEMVELPAGNHGNGGWWMLNGLGYDFHELKDFYLPGQLIEEGTNFYWWEFLF